MGAVPNMKQNILHNDKGVTLLELLISLGILGLLAVGFAAVFIPVFQLNGNATQLNRGNADLTTKLEDAMDSTSSVSGVTYSSATGSDEISITINGKTITGPGQFAEAEDPATGAKLKAYVPIE